MMKTNIKIPANSMKTRVLSMFMAFLIFTLTFQEAFVGWDFGMRASAVTGDGTTIYSTTGSTGTVKHSTSTIYQYQGDSNGDNYQTASVTLFDYVSDEEIAGTYNSISDSSVSNYKDPYTSLNTAISNSGSRSYASSSNITIVLQKFPGLYSSTDPVCIFMEDDNGHYTTWPGDRMTYHYGSDGDEFIYTFNPTALGFTPVRIKFSKNGDNTIPAAAARTGFTFSGSYKQNGDSDGYKVGKTYYIKWSDGDNSQKIWEASGSNDLYNCSYTYPLYFGAFLTGANADLTSNYTEHTAPNYNNCYWLPNMAPRSHTGVSVQGLVDDNLSGSSYTGNLLDTDGSTTLPYLNADWAGSNPTLVKYYNKDGNGNQLSFPFYEVRAAANESAVSKKASDSSISSEYARFYQFNSAETSVRFDIAKTSGTVDPSLHTGDFIETSVAKYSSLNNVGFFPFESANHKTQNNLGFGAKFEMQFKLQPDGCVSPIDSTGKTLNDSDTRIDTVFEFTGDDDLWVFIDGNLILDMGGDHGQSSGSINFRTKTATADSAVTIGSGNLYNLGVSGSALSPIKNENVGTASETFGFTSKLADAAYYAAHKEYNPNTVHTMTIFYMERGMNDSNLLIRYNYSTIATSPRMKIQEITDFSGVNDGLLAYTQKAADKDAFEYTVYNKGTNSNDVKDSDAAYPTTVSHIRNNYYDPNDNTVYQSTNLTPNGTGTSSVSNFSPSGTNTFDPVANTTYAWEDRFANMYSSSKGGDGKGAGKTDANGKLYIMYGTADTESSAEFEKQFSKYSYMRIIQGDNLYRQGSASSGGSTYYTLNNSSSRALSDYYTLTRVHTLDAGQEVVNDLTTTYKADPTAYSFEFVNDASVSSNVATMMTEYFTNTVKTASIQITKNVTGSTSNTNFGFEIELSNVFGVSTVAFNNHGDLVSVKNSDSPTTANITGTNKGAFTLQNGDTLTISGIPVHTKYKITETSGRGQTVTGEVTDGEIQTSDNGTTIKVTVTNKFQTETGVDVLKKNSSNEPLSGAEFELWYKETVPPQTYSFNEPKIAPNEINGMKVTETPASVGVPSPVVPKSVTNYTVTTTYTDPSVPNADEEEWILPRNDTDYIYFRDYNDKSESGAAYGEWDEGSFTSSDKYAWRSTTFIHHPVHNQDLELSYDESKWFAAEFSGNGKKTVRYAVWERFVDEYSDKTTVIWKIQPPDGYTDVRFMLLKGDTVIRKTVKFKYELGKIYHKTNWGGYWTSQNGQNCYYDVPVTQESATNNGYWAPKGTESTINDKRMSAAPYTNSDEITYTRQMLQARKYEPTAQKVIFHCNSTNVWHNIHIEFFEDAQGSNPVNGQAFPGYMMEPFAYAGNNYRLGNYLTYELTIPANAKYFRINNGEAPSTYHGETSGTYSYQTAIMPLKNATTGEGQKNYGNYWCFGSGSYSDTGATLVQWTPQKEENNATNTIPAKDYKNAEVTSDYDYIYFKNTANWSKVYAYFYAGGDLRGDNWQRATYSSWPGVAPAGTEYGTVHSNTYTDHTTGDQYNGTTTGGTLNPVATFTSGGYKIYKFRIPKGDRKNYSKVIFNSGLDGTETGVIDYQPGHIYDKDGKSEKHYENSPTKLYTASTNDALSGTDKTEYIYVKNTLNWDDLHVTFYGDNGGQILQGGKGYVMEYAGNSTNDYFKIPLPENAAMFSVNNGIGSANSSKVSQKADIIRYGDDGKTKSTKGADDRFVYTLSGSGTTASPYVLTRDGFTTTSTKQTSRPAPQEEGFADYTVAVAATDTAPATYSVRQHGTTPNIVEHTLNIRDAANWNVDIGRISVTFYKSDGSQIGPNVMIKTVADAQGKVWYTKKIHPDAVSFTVSYSTESGTNPTTYTTPKYPIYPYSASAPADGSNYTSTGHMFFDTVGTGANSKLVMTHEEPVNADNAVDDETYSQRGDYLYLITNSDTAPDITFYASGTNVIKSGIKGKYINHDSEGYWYKVAIPTGAQSFWATGMTDGTKAAIYELRAKYSPYRKDYTLGDMQYRISDGATLLYPVFTADTYNTLDVSTGNTISSRTPILVDETQISAYEGASAATLPTSSGSTPAKEILYNTANDNVTYSWTEGEAADDMLRFEKPSDWSVPTTAAYYNGSTLVESKSFSLDSGSIYKVTVPNNTYDSVVITDGTHSTSTISLTSYNGGKNYKISRTTANTTYNDGKVRFDNSATQWSNVYVHFWNGSTESGTWYQMTDSDGDNIFEYTVPSGTYDHVRFSSDQSSSSNNPKTLALSRSNGGKNAKFTPDIDNTNIYFQVGSTPWGVHSSKIYAYYYDPGEYKTWGANCPEHKRDDEKEIHFEIGGIASTFKKLIVFGYENGTKWQSVSINVEGTPENGGGRIYKIKSDTDSNGHYNVEFLGYGSYPDNSGSWSSSGTVTTWPLTLYSSSTQTTYTYSYQPEDRYGMISDQNTSPAGVLGKNDTNNFITLVLPDTITKPYIKFYSDVNHTTYINTDSSANSSAKGLLLNGNSMTLNSTSYNLQDSTGTGTVTYKVRIPKNAKSFRILNGTNSKFTQALEETGVSATITYTDPDTNAQSSQTVTVPGTFRHAGTTFAYDGSTVTKTLRTGFTPYKQSTMVDPLDPMTDNDFIYFTDTGSFANSGKVFAYFYGGADGEYKAWPGTVATTTNNQDVAATTYTDNNGKTVYKFRVPKDSDGNYTKVIFNNGQSGSDLKITAAQTVVGGMNYTLGNYIGQDYGTMTDANKVFDVTTANKASAATATYSNSANKTIYFINNGTKCVVAGETDLTDDRYILDDIHVEFFTSEGSGAIGTADPGYIPQKVGTKDGYDVYRIVAPNNAQYFRINNGTGKGSVNGHNHDRKSEIKLLTNNGLYKFVTDATKYTKDGTRPTTIQALSTPEYLLQLVNPREVDDEDQSDAEHFDVKLAVVKTGSNGTVDKILWLKNSLSNVDSAYLANTNNSTTPPVKVVKSGEYYWKEVTPPSGYKLPDDPIQKFTLPTTGSTTTTFTDPKNDTGSLTIKKTLYSVDTTDPIDPVEEEKNKRFKFTIELIAPIGTNWNSSNLSSAITIKDKDDNDKSADSAWLVSDDKTTTTSLVRTVVVKLPADGQAYVTIGGLPYGTTYSVTEQPIKMAGTSLTEVMNTDYTSEPIIINKSVKETSSSTAVDSTAESVDGTIENYSTSYLLTNKHEVGSLNLKDIVVDHGVNALVHANVNQPKTYTPPYDPPIYDWYKYNYLVTLTAPEGVDLDDYITKAQLDAITGITDGDSGNPTTVTNPNVVYTSRAEASGGSETPSKYTFHIYVTSAPDGMRTISNIPLGTRYIVTEELPTNSYETDKENPSATNSDSHAKAGVTWQKSGEVKSTDTAQYVDETHRSPTVTITNNYWYSPTLKLQKTRAVTTGSTLPTLTPDGQTKVAGLDYFVYTVTLTAPNSKNWNDPSFSVTGIPTGTDLAHNSITFKVNVTPGTDTQIVGLPVGTTYTVSELSADNPTPSGYKCVTSPASNSGTVGDGESVAAFTNTYTQFGKMKITKEIKAPTNGHEPNNGTYTFSGTLSTGAGGLDISQASYLPTAVSGVAFDTEHYDKSTNTLSFTATITISSGTTGYVEITNIPYGTTYSFSEDARTDNATVGYSGDGTDVTSGTTVTGKTGTINSSDNEHEVTVSNTYPDTFKLTLKKSVGGTLPTGVTDTSDTKFKYHVVLEAQNGLGLERYSISGIPNGTSYTNGKYDFYISVPVGTDVEITGIPSGTKYSVTEVADLYINSSDTETALTNTGVTTTYSYASTTGASSGPSGQTLSDDTTVAVTNTYPTSGTLELRKRLAGGNRPSNVPNANQTYTFNVTLNNASNPTIDVSKFTLTKQVGSGTATPISPSDITTDNGSISFTVEIKAGSGNSDSANDVKIGGIPYGVTYMVSEATESKGGTTADSTVYTDDTNKKIGTGADDVVTITNTYTQVGSLEITKTLEGADKANSDKNENSLFTFTVQLTMAAGMDKDFYINNVTPANMLTDDNYTALTGELGYFTFDISASPNSPVTIGNLPYGSAYTVVETDPGNGWTSRPFVITDSIDASQKTAAFTNTFARSLTLRKVDARTQQLITSSPAEFVLFRLPSGIGANDLNTAMASAQTEPEKLTALKTYVIDKSGYYYPENGTTFTTTGGLLTLTESQVGGSFGTDNFFFFEVSAPTGYVPDNTATESRIFSFASGEADKIVTFPNGVQPTDVTVEKQDDNGNGLGDAELDLYYQENIVPSTYNINTPVTEPAPLPDRQIRTNILTVPDVDGTTEKTTFNYQYSGVTDKPNAEENAWILPRTDNDYIYFRDFNIGTTAEWDDVEVTNSSNGNKRYWLKTTLGYNEYGQVQEINYNHDYWFAAKFYNNNGDVKYAMWERFVDKYTHDGHTYDTIVWKIQPPDGYNRVRFCLYKGDNCVRNTQEITFELGKVYTKKGWGTEYKEEYGNKCYFNVPVDSGENWSTYYTNPNTNGTMDKRNTATTALYQADRYTATPQKVIFHCNSNQVWHNIHIEFFDANKQPIGQKFPGYMMEPYAKADHDTYRINGYLSYELTIPEGARYFRVNNGVASDKTYGYHTEIKALYTGTETVEGKTASQYKNYHNYFHLGKSSGSYPGGVNVGNGSEVKLSTWQNDFITGVGDNLYEQFDNTNEIEADGDYIYLALPTESGTVSDWNKEHVYAYFYGGGNLRQDNWQRACYSIWPGVAPVSTEYTTYPAGINTGTDTHSDIYTYSYDGTLYESGDASISNPETRFDYTRDGKAYIVYKFRVPLGDRTNYDFVIFNDGTVENGGGHETNVIDYSAGTLYLADCTADSHNYKQTTDLYTSNRGDYLYVRMNSATLNNWDDLHVTFYNANGTQILQGGTGYVMKYSGVKDDYTYFKVPVPDNAKKFSLNNGYDNYTSSNGNKAIDRPTAQYDILEKVTETPTSEGKTLGGMLYTLSGTSLTLTEPTMTITKHIESQSGSYPLDASSSPRGDFIFIRDDAGKFTNTNTVTFKDAAGNTITKSVNGGTATANFLTVNKHVVEQVGDPQWYSVGIPVEAVSFTVNDGTTNVIVDQPIFAKTTENVGTADNFTTDGMYFKTTDSTPVLEILWPTFTQAPGTTNYNDDNYSDGGRGDALYIITPNRDDWTGQYVVFYDEDGEPIKNTSNSENIGANYIGELTAVSEGESPVSGVSTDRAEAVGHWFKAYIPTTAKTFKVFSSDDNELGQGDIYKLRTKTARYHDDYTLGDMEYRLDVTGHKLTAVYPVFTEIPPSSSQELEVSKRANETAASQYITSSVESEGSYTSGDTAMPVLYPTSSDTITYEWTEV